MARFTHGPDSGQPIVTLSFTMKLLQGVSKCPTASQEIAAPFFSNDIRRGRVQVVFGMRGKATFDLVGCF